MIPARTPILGILNEVERPHQNMVAIITGTPPNKLRWAYVTRKDKRHAGCYPYQLPEYFTPLSAWGVHATMTWDGKLALHQLNPKPALYPDGKPRFWQGAVESIIEIVPRHLGEVVRAIKLDAEERKAELARASA